MLFHFIYSPTKRGRNFQFQFPLLRDEVITNTTHQISAFQEIIYLIVSFFISHLITLLLFDHLNQIKHEI